MNAALILAGFVALQGAEVRTMQGPVLHDATVILYGERILSVGKGAKIPSGASVIDARNKVITPGFIHPYSHLGLVEVSKEKAGREGLYSPAEPRERYAKPVRAALRVVDGLNPNSSLIAVARAAGITSAVVVPRGGLISGQAAWIRTAGRDGMDLVTAHPLALVADVTSRGRKSTGGRAGAWLTLRESLYDAKVYSSRRKKFETNQTRAFSTSRLDLDALNLVLAGKVPLVIKADRASDIQASLDLARQFRIKVVLVGGAEAWMLAGDLAAAKMPVVVRVFENLPAKFDSLAARADNAALLHLAGVKLALMPAGWSVGTFHARRLRQEAANAVAQGLPADVALKAITRNVVEIFGVKDQRAMKGLGTLQAGAPGDLVLWSGDPLRIESRAEMVFIRGQQIPQVNRQTELLKRYRNLDR